MNAAVITEYLLQLRSEKNLSNNTINKHRTHLMTLFEFAIKNEERYEIQINPVRKIRPLRHEPYAYKIYSPDEAKYMMHILHSTANLILETAVALALYCGCRREEVCGLRWENVNLSKKYYLPLIRFHDLRHTNLSLLMSQMSAIDVAKIGGYAKVSTTTNIYGHRFTDTVERGKSVINSLL